MCYMLCWRRLLRHICSKKDYVLGGFSGRMKSSNGQRDTGHIWKEITLTHICIVPFTVAKIVSIHEDQIAIILTIMMHFIPHCWQNALLSACGVSIAPKGENRLCLIRIRNISTLVCVARKVAHINTLLNSGTSKLAELTMIWLVLLLGGSAYPTDPG